MFYQDVVVGALAVITRAGEPPAEGQGQSLAVLANNAAIALENTRLFEQERETVRRLRELDALKSDFLGTVQHELRTPLTAIMGMGDLLEMCWDTWDDPHKTEALHDIQVAAKKLYDIVETILDFSLLESDTLSLKPLPTRVRSAVEEAVTAVQARLKDGLQVSLSVDVPADVEVYADPTRFNQALRALLDNAVKFTPEGGSIWVRTHLNGDEHGAHRGRRQRHRNPRGRPAPGLRALLPGRQHRDPHLRRHRDGSRPGAPPRRGPRRQGRGGEPGGGGDAASPCSGRSRRSSSDRRAPPGGHVPGRFRGYNRRRSR